MTDTVSVSSSGKASIKKDPNAVLDYPFDWTDWLDLINDEIATSPNDPSYIVTGGLVLDSKARDGTRGTGKNWKTSAAGYAIGTTAISIAGGTGTILATDLVKFAGDDILYPVASYNAGALVLGAPGLKSAIPAVATDMTVRAVATPIISGGTAGVAASVTCRIKTVGGRTEDRTLYMKVKER